MPTLAPSHSSYVYVHIYNIVSVSDIFFETAKQSLYADTHIITDLLTLWVVIKIEKI